MALNSTPYFTKAPILGAIAVTAANTGSDGSGALNTIYTAGADGAWIDYIRAINSQASAAASSAMVIRVFATYSGHTTLIAEVALAAATRSTSAIGAQTIIPLNIYVPNGTVIKVIQSVYAGVQDRMDYTLFGADLAS